MLYYIPCAVSSGFGWQSFVFVLAVSMDLTYIMYTETRQMIFNNRNEEVGDDGQALVIQIC